MLKEIPQKTKVKIDAYKFENPLDSFIQVEPPSSDKIATARSAQRIKPPVILLAYILANG